MDRMATYICDASDQLPLSISALRDRGEFSDLVLRHDVESFQVHRIIVCAQSKVFYKACTGGFEEEFTGIIQMNHVNYIELKKLVNFFYDSEYDDCLPEDADLSLLQLHARMFALADQYDIPGLKTLAAEKYSSRCTTSQTLELLVSLRDVYETTPPSIRRLRHTAYIAVRKRLPEILRNKEASEMYDKILSEIPDFTKDLLRCYVSDPVYGHCQSCCSHQPMELLQARCKKCKKGCVIHGW
jgi:hypothetical protein